MRKSIAGAGMACFLATAPFALADPTQSVYAVLLYGNEILRREGGREALEGAIGAARVRVPTLVLQGERDRHNNCCIVERVRAIEAAARTRGAPSELVVYPGAEHG